MAWTDEDDMANLFIVVGVLLCCTLIGAILGIPMIYAGVKHFFSS